MSCSTDDLIGNLEKIRSCGCRGDNSQERDISQVALNEVIVSGPSTSYCLRVVNQKSYIEFFVIAVLLYMTNT